MLGVMLLAMGFEGCVPLAVVDKNPNNNPPGQFQTDADSTNSAQQPWKSFFTDSYLVALIDTALQNNQELNITLQEIEIARNEVRARKGEYLPFVNAGAGMGVEKVGRYTSKGSSEATTEIKPGKETPDPLPDFMAAVYAHWEVDIWHKLRNAKKAAFERYLSTVEGKNFLVTNLVGEIAASYYELLGLDNQLEILKQNIEIQSNALKIVRLEKQSARVTELAVRRFEAEVLHTQSRQFEIQQRITETENRINFLVGRYAQPVQRTSGGFNNMIPAMVATGVPSQLLENRPDIRQAMLDLQAAKLDVQVAKARFYPSLDISAGIGWQAFNPAFLIRTPQSMLFSLAGDMMAPLVNRNGLIAVYNSANAKQIQAIYQYEQKLLNAYLEVANQVARVQNLKQSYDLKSKQVVALNESINISTTLFKSAKADYMEVLLTQRDALESKFELVETRMQQMNAAVSLYKALGGGWK